MDYYIRQLTENDCAFTCLKILLANVLHNKDFLYMPNPKQDKTISLWDIIEISKSYGVILEGIRVKNVTEEIKFKSKPIIVMLRNDNDTLHLVYVKRVTRKDVIILDPKNGRIKISKIEFLKKWSGVYLRIKEIKSIKKPKKINLVNRGYIFLSCFLQIIASLLVVFGFYFIDESSSFTLPMMFFSMYAIILIFTNMNTKKAIKNFDCRISTAVYKSKNCNFQSNFENIVKYKSLVLTSPIKLISNIMICLFIIILISINDFKNIYFVAILLIVALIDLKVFSLLKNKYSRKIEVLEEKICDINCNSEQFSILYNDLSYLTNRFSTIILIRKYLINFIIFCLSFVLMAINKILAINYLIFTFFLYSLLYQSISDIFSYKDVREECDFLKAKFVSLLKSHE